MSCLEANVPNIVFSNSICFGHNVQAGKLLILTSVQVVSRCAYLIPDACFEAGPGHSTTKSPLLQLIWCMNTFLFSPQASCITGWSQKWQGYFHIPALCFVPEKALPDIYTSAGLWSDSDPRFTVAHQGCCFISCFFKGTCYQKTHQCSNKKTIQHTSGAGTWISFFLLILIPSVHPRCRTKGCSDSS